jgi:hypothetical protein
LLPGFRVWIAHDSDGKSFDCWFYLAMVVARDNDYLINTTATQSNQMPVNQWHAL